MTGEYIVPNDFRSASLAEYCAQLELTIEEAEDTRLAATIARLSQRLDDYTDDHFQPETLTLDMAGSGTPVLVLPKRCTAVTAVSIIDDTAAVTAQATTIYRLRSSLESGTRRSEARFDQLSIIPTSTGLTGLPLGWNNIYKWPTNHGCIRVAGSFGWTATPADIKRAVALMVWDYIKPMRADLHRAGRLGLASGEAIEFAATEPTGIPEADRIIEDYRRDLYGMG